MEGRRLKGRRKREATRISDRHPDPVAQADRYPDDQCPEAQCPVTRAATALAGRSSRQCLRGRLLRPAGWASQVAPAARWVVLRQAVRPWVVQKGAAVTGRRAVQAHKAEAMVEAATVHAPTAEADIPVPHSTCGSRSPLRAPMADARPRVMAEDVLLPALGAAILRPAATAVVDPPTEAADRTAVVARTVEVAADMGGDIEIALGLFPA